MSAQLNVLAVDDEAPSLADLVYELRAQPEVARVVEVPDATSALRALREEAFDVVFLDIRMPGLDGLELARVLQQFKQPPPVVFVTAHAAHAVEAFEIRAVDYLLKPVRAERLQLAIQRVIELASERVVDHASDAPSPEPNISAAPNEHVSAVAEDHREATITIESGGRVLFVDRDDVLFVSASGDYVRLHLRDGSYLYRAAMATLEERWSSAGFVRIHRGYLVALRHIDEVRVEPTRGHQVRIGTHELPVSRRLTPQVRSRLFDYAASRRRS